MTSSSIRRRSSVSGSADEPAHHSGRPATDLELVDPAAADDRRPIVRFRLEQIEIAPDAPCQWRRSRHPQTGDKML